MVGCISPGQALRQRQQVQLGFGRNARVGFAVGREGACTLDGDDVGVEGCEN